tara:strand:+ start:301 stop:678 length:378 start_codon:yes stop_codon:yes gene_type:complete
MKYADRKHFSEYHEFDGQSKRLFKQRMVERENRGRNAGGTKFFDEKVSGKKRADSLDRTQGAENESSSEYKNPKGKQSLLRKREYENIYETRNFESMAEKFSEPRLEDYESQYHNESQYQGDTRE